MNFIRFFFSTIQRNNQRERYQVLRDDTDTNERYREPRFPSLLSTDEGGYHTFDQEWGQRLVNQRAVNLANELKAIYVKAYVHGANQSTPILFYHDRNSKGICAECEADRHLWQAQKTLVNDLNLTIIEDKIAWAKRLVEYTQTALHMLNQQDTSITLPEQFIESKWLTSFLDQYQTALYGSKHRPLGPSHFMEP